ncbi:DNA RNA-binding Alba [Cordyceps militaris]|uniref:DNA RNA-binding Alba n=1 Tax=Cordyceps militaris TaxID=73501 RepID=A0A2H4SD47_CORMI|nr:DNA RNA-binding Alba [Cordyceps militaris]
MDHASKKRKSSTSLDQPAKKPRPPPPADAHAAQDSPLCQPHAAVLGALAAKYDVLPASIISSTPIRKRVVRVTTHLLSPDGQKPRVVLLHGRVPETCKLITVAEMCKRLLYVHDCPAWYQYNQLFELPPGDAERGRRKASKHVVEETVLQGEERDEEEDEDESDAFETMQSRFENAVLPPTPDRTTKSLRIFLSTVPIPELKATDGVSVQTSEMSDTE